MPGFQFERDPGSDPAIDEDAHEQPDRAGEIASQHIGQPVFTFQDARVADGQDIKHAVNLKWDEQPAIFPCAYWRCKAEEEQEAIIGHVMLCMA